MKRELVGHVGVDSGQVMVGDPCYLKQWKDVDLFDDPEWKRQTSGASYGGRTTPTGTYDYLGASTASCSEKGHGELGGGDACVASSGWGDGSYPVYVERDPQSGRVARLVVEFMDEDEDEDDMRSVGLG